MNKKQYIKTLMNEIKRLNERIDLKIACGHRYTKDAQRHLALIKKLATYE